MVRTVVMKFGGTSVQDADAFGRLVSIVAGERDATPVVVVSALAGITNALVAAAQMADGGEPEYAIDSIEEGFSRHADISRQFMTGADSERFERLLHETNLEVRH